MCSDSFLRRPREGHMEEGDVIATVPVKLGQSAAVTAEKARMAPGGGGLATP